MIATSKRAYYLSVHGTGGQNLQRTISRAYITERDTAQCIESSHSRARNPAALCTTRLLRTAFASDFRYTTNHLHARTCTLQSISCAQLAEDAEQADEPHQAQQAHDPEHAHHAHVGLHLCQ